MLALTDTDVWAITATAVALATLMALFALIRSKRDKTVKRTRWGFFVERDHYDESPKWPTRTYRSEEQTQVKWPEVEKEKEEP